MTATKKCPHLLDLGEGRKETPMNALIPFHYEGSSVRVLTGDDGQPWFVVKDVCDYFGVTNRNRVMQHVDAEDKGGTQMNTPGGIQEIATINESGLYTLLFHLTPTRARGLSDEEIEQKTALVRSFRRWVTHEVLPSIRRHGVYATPALTGPALMAAALIEAHKTIEATEQRAVKAETVVAAITDGGGITLTQFHKHHFPDVPARVFFQHLYDHQLLIDQRGKGRWDDKRNRYREGPQHRHPTYKGKAYMYLDGCLDGKDKRREYTKVRPGQPEVDLVELLARQGLPAALPSMSTVPALPAA